MNLTALRKVRDRMGQHTDRIRMDAGWAHQDFNQHYRLCARTGVTMTAGELFEDPEVHGCICGWTLATLAPSFKLIDQGKVGNFNRMVQKAARLLGISRPAAHYLFHGCWMPSRRLGWITGEEAVAYLDRLLAGEQLTPQPIIQLLRHSRPVDDQMEQLRALVSEPQATVAAPDEILEPVA